MEQVAWSTLIAKPAIVIRDAARSRIAWLAVSLHALWFVLAVANMSPPSPELGDFLDTGGWSSSTLFAGRPFHFHYEASAAKLLWLVDLPAMLGVIPFSLLIVPLSRVFDFGFFVASYLTASVMLLGASCQWLLVGYKTETWVRQKLPALHRALHRSATFLIVAIIVAGYVLAPTINERSRAAGFKHGGISFR